jgi:Ca2+/Na+ antiporter
MSQKQNNGHNRHLLMILMCCLAMFAALWVLFKDSSGENIWLLFLLCPLMHFFMMKKMHNHNENQNEDEDEKHHDCH